VPSGRSELTYRPHLDGLRCVAVYLVLAYHAGPRVFRRGFIGVDVFFVLSGYLVTRILLRDLVTLCRVDLRRFYARRVRRILPAATVVLTVTAVAYAVIATPLQIFRALDGVRAAFLYVSNWFFIHQSVDYFGGNVNRSPVLQFWSLSVEEQFYLLWPVGLTVLFVLTARVGRWRWWVLRFVISAAALASAFAALHIAATNPDRAYYGTDTRAYQLLAGALLALTPQLFRLRGSLRRMAPWVASITLVGLVLASTSIVEISAISRGIVAVALTTVLIVAVENARGGVAKRALSLRPVTYLGVVSYGTYLWHWPVVVVATHGRHLSRSTLFVLTCTVATALAALSYHVLEHPIRASKWLNRYRVPVVAVGLTVSIVGGLVLAPAILETDGVVSARAGAGGKFQKIDFLAALARADLPDCLGNPVEECTVVPGNGLRVVVMGDSHARMWIPAFEAIAKDEGWALSVAALNECPWQRGLRYGQSNEGIRANCLRHQEDWYRRVVPQLKPDIVILTHQSFDEPAYRPMLVLPDERFGRSNPFSSFRAKVLALTESSVRTLESVAGKVVIIEPILRTPLDFDPLDCLSSGKPIKDCAYRMKDTPTRQELLYRSLDDHRRVWDLDFDRLACPRLPVCDAVLGGMIVKRDGAHLTVDFARSLAPAIATAFRKAGILATR
jgi:peptidoglycan/LPS O-acetylase OafA/YrhL